jgi:hypothetical protein
MPYFSLDAETIVSLLRAVLSRLLEALNDFLLALIAPPAPRAPS